MRGPNRHYAWVPSEEWERLLAWHHHRSAPFPESIEKDDARWDEVHPVLVDAEVAGLISHVVGRSRLTDQQRVWLEGSLRDLDYVVANVPEPAAGYFLGLQEMARLALLPDLT